MSHTPRSASALTMTLLALAALLLAPLPARAAHLHYGWQQVDGLHIFFREGGRRDAPTVVFLHGNPSSSIQYQEVMENLLDRDDIHVIAMDYPSFGYSDAPDHTAYAYTFDSLARTVSHFLAARGVRRYALFMQDYGVPVGFRLIEADPSAITAVMVQNGVIHLDGFPQAQDENGELRRHWRKRNPAVDARRVGYNAALRAPAADNWEYDDAMNPEAILLMRQAVQRPGAVLGRNDLWFDYGSNVARYPRWQALLHSLGAPVLVLWGRRDDFFTTPGAVAYLRDAPRAEVHIFDGDHFATLEQPELVTDLTASFIHRTITAPAAPPPAGQERRTGS